MNGSTLLATLLIYFAPTLYVVAMLVGCYWIARRQEKRQAGVL